MFRFFFLGFPEKDGFDGEICTRISSKDGPGRPKDGFLGLSLGSKQRGSVFRTHYFDGFWGFSFYEKRPKILLAQRTGRVKSKISFFDFCPTSALDEENFGGFLIFEKFSKMNFSQFSEKNFSFLRKGSI